MNNTFLDPWYWTTILYYTLPIVVATAARQPIPKETIHKAPAAVAANDPIAPQVPAPAADPIVHKESQSLDLNTCFKVKDA
jgi:hypothetical protein